MRRREWMILLSGALIGVRPLRAQQKAMPIIGLLVVQSRGPFASLEAAFREGLKETGRLDGKTVAIEYRWAEGRYDRLPALAADLVDRKVNVITANGIAAALEAKRATSTIPIVFIIGSDPVADGLVASLARPGGNLTGVTVLNTELISKRLEFLSELLPQLSVVALLVNPNNQGAERIIEDFQRAARAKGIQSQILKAGSESEIETAFASLAQFPSPALSVGGDPAFSNLREQIVALASRHAIPTNYANRLSPTAGGLISYGPSLTGTWRQLGIYAGKILNGAKPADLPVEQPAKFELVINLKTTKVLGLTVPPAILARADEVIE